MNFAIWSAVSTAAQAASDKVSLKVQQDSCRASAASKTWLETAGPFIVSGESRTRWVNLRDAEDNIPALREMLNSAKRGEFNVLVMYDFNRLRDLLDPVARVLADYGVQIYSLSQPIEPSPPELFNADTSDTSSMLQSMSGITSRAEINNLRRHYRDKMPTRITTHGLHAGTGKPPYGYRKPPGHEFDSKAVLIPDPATARIAIQIKDWYLSGQSYTHIARQLNDQKIPSPGGSIWRPFSVSYILSSSFYAGLVTWGSRKTKRDRRTGTLKRYKAAPVTNHGKHSPLWDEATYARLCAEIARRGPAHSGWRTRQLSRLLYCTCGKVLWVQVNNFYTPKGDWLWVCSSGLPGHVRFNNARIMPLFIAALVKQLKDIKHIKLPTPADKRPRLGAAIADLTKRKQRWMDAFELGQIEAGDYAARVSSLTDQLDTAQKELSTLQTDITQLTARKHKLTVLASALDTLPAYILHSDMPQVNSDLRSFLAKVHVTKDLRLTLEWL